MLKPQPRVNEFTRPFWDGCNANELRMQKCQNARCGKIAFYPRVCCPHCQSETLEWIAVERRGTIVSHTTVHRSHHDGFNSELPYVFAAVNVAGALLYAQVPGAPTDGTSLVGRAVRVDFVEHGPDRKLPVVHLDGA